MNFNETIKLGIFKKAYRFVNEIFEKIFKLAELCRLRASITVVFTLSDFLRKSSAQTNVKNLSGEPKPLE